MSDIAKVIRIKDPITLKVLIIHQDCSTEIFSILPWTNLDIDTIWMVKSLLQNIIVTGDKFSRGGDIDLRSSLFLWHQFQ